MKNPKTITLNQVKRTAAEFLHQYHPLLTLPIPIEDIAELKLNIRIILINGLIRNFGVNAFISQDFNSIVIDEMMFTRQPKRIRFTIAEEIGHLFLHKNWYINNGPKSLEDYLDWQEKLDKSLFDYIERQAKTFAGMILMPETLILKKWKDFARQSNLADPCNVYSLPDTFPEFANEFAVSTVSLLVRLNFLKLVKIPYGFWKKVSRR